MFEDLLKSLGLGNGKPTQQGKDALNTLLANTGTGYRLNELTQQEEGANALNSLLANTGTQVTYTPQPYTPQPTALDNLLSQPIQTIGNAIDTGIDYGKNLLSDAIANPTQTIKNISDFVASPAPLVPILSFADKVINGGEVGNFVSKEVKDFGRQGLNIGASLLNAGITGISNTADEIKYTNGTLTNNEKTAIQDYYNNNVDKYIAGELDEKTFLEGVNTYTNQKGLLQGFKSVDDVAGLLNDTRANTIKAIQRNKDWEFLTPEQKGYNEKVENSYKQDPTYLGFETFFNEGVGKDQGINPAIKSNIRGGYEVLKSGLEYTIKKQASELIAMENRGASEEAKADYKAKSDALIKQQYDTSVQLLNDIQEAVRSKSDFDTFATEKYKELGGIDGLVSEAIKKAGVEGTLLNATSFEDAADQLASDAALQGFGDAKGFVQNYQGGKQALVGSVGKLFEQSDKIIRKTQGGVGSDFSAAGLAGLSNVNFESGDLYEKGFWSYVGEGATLAPDVASVILPGGSWKLAGRVGRFGESLKTLNNANKIVNGLAYGAGTALQVADYAKRGVSLTKDIVTLGVLDEINTVGKIRGTKLLQGLSDAHFDTLSNIAAKGGKVVQELAKDNAISALISRYTADAYGGQESKRWNDVYIDSAFNVFDIWSGLKQGAKAIDGIKARQTNLGKEITGQSGIKSLSLRDAEKLGETLDSQFYAVKGILDKKDPVQFKKAYEQITGKQLTGEETGQAMNELKLKLAKNIIESTNATQFLGTNTAEQLSKLKKIDELVRDDTIAPRGLIDFITGNTTQAVIKSGGGDALQALGVSQKLNQGIKLSGDILAQNSLTVKPNSLGETLGLTVPKIAESDVDRVKGILTSNDKNPDEYITKQDDGSYVLKEDKYDELGIAGNKQQNDLIQKMSDNGIISQEIGSQLSGLKAVKVLEDAIGGVLC